MDKLLASPPREQQPARIHSPNSSFTPVQRSRDNNLLVAGNEGEKERKISTSSLNIQIRPHDIVAPNEVSVFEADLHHQYQLSPYHAEDEVCIISSLLVHLLIEKFRQHEICFGFFLTLYLQGETDANLQDGLAFKVSLLERD